VWDRALFVVAATILLVAGLTLGKGTPWDWWIIAAAAVWGVFVAGRGVALLKEWRYRRRRVVQRAQEARSDSDEILDAFHSVFHKSS
jgi:hypothetical protein